MCALRASGKAHLGERKRGIRGMYDRSAGFNNNDGEASSRFIWPRKSHWKRAWRSRHKRKKEYFYGK